MNIKNKVRSSYPSNAQWINHSIAQNEIINLNDYHVEGHASELPSEMLSERILQDYAVTCLPSLQATKYTSAWAKKDLEYLNLKLDAVRKTITSWDVYNIKGVAESEEDVDHMISIATPNTAFISNVRVEKQHISPGDIVFTDLNNKIHIIQHAAAGYFYPARWEQQKDPDTKLPINTYKLTYSWSTTDPILDSESILNSTEILSPVTDKISATINTSSELGFAQTYILRPNTKWKKIEDYPLSHSTNVVRSIPLITVFTADGEKIWLDNILKYIDQDHIDPSEYPTVGWYITNPTFMTISVEVR